MKYKTDSRKVEKGDIFVALRGVNHDGHSYIADAIEKGATKVVAEEGLYPVETYIVKDTHEYLVQTLKREYYDEIKDLKLIGITGTNGKTTSCYLIHQALNRLGRKCGYIGTIGFYIDEKICDLSNTTPDILDLYDMLLTCKKEGCEFVAMEVSSHSLDMNRVDGLLFDYAIFTNLTQDHLDYHGNMKNYALAKQKLFRKMKEQGTCFINIDDDNSYHFLLPENHNITYGFRNGSYRITNMTYSLGHTDFIVSHEGEKTYQMQLIGKHNLYNMLVVIMLLEELGIGESEIRKTISLLEEPRGRMECVRYHDALIIVDYAHTPDAVSNAIHAVLEIPHGKIYTIIGCGGDRDRAKRPEMAKIATNLSDCVIFTSDNPRNEDPEHILEDMEHGLDNTNYEKIVNRKEAINRGIQMLQKSDILLLLGKGHETYQVIGNKKIHFDDMEEVKKIIK